VKVFVIVWYVYFGSTVTVGEKELKMSNEKINTIAELVKAGLSPKEAVATFAAMQQLKDDIKQLQNVQPVALVPPPTKLEIPQKSKLIPKLYLVTVDDGHCWLTVRRDRCRNLTTYRQLESAWAANKHVMEVLNTVPDKDKTKPRIDFVCDVTPELDRFALQKQMREKYGALYVQTEFICRK